MVSSKRCYIDAFLNGGVGVGVGEKRQRERVSSHKL